MESSLENLPTELIEIIVKLLRYRDVASLRCTSRTLESKASYGSFTRRFHRKNIKLEMKTLERLALLSTEIYPTSRLQHCTVTGVVGLDEVASEDLINEHTQLLTTIFRNLRKNIQNGSIASLSLRVVLRITRRTAHKWQDTFATARRTFEITMAALNESNLSINENLDLFSDVPGCALEYTAFLHLAQRPGPANIFKNLKRLTMKLSSRVADTVETNYFYPTPPLDALRQGEHVALTLDAISHISTIMPKLESLDLHWINIGQNTRSSPPPARRDITSSSTPFALKECTLRGIFISGINLLQFLTSTDPITLTLKDVDLITGTYDSSFKYLTLPNSPTTYCHFENLYHFYHIVHFGISEVSEEADETAEDGSTTFSQEITGLEYEGISHQMRPATHDRWRNYMISIYGSLISRSFAFIPQNGRHIDVEISARPS